MGIPFSGVTSMIEKTRSAMMIPIMQTITRNKGSVMACCKGEFFGDRIDLMAKYSWTLCGDPAVRWRA